jgi:hypothetical protein
MGKDTRTYGRSPWARRRPEVEEAPKPAPKAKPKAKKKAAPKKAAPKKTEDKE